MLAPAALRDALLLETASDIGKTYLQQLVCHLARLTGAGCVYLSQRDRDTRHYLQVLYSSQPDFPHRYALDGMPCASVFANGSTLRVDNHVGARFPAQPDHHWQSMAAWPLLDGNQRCIGHLAMLDERDNRFSDALIHALQPLVRRAAAELQRLQRNEKQQRQMYWQAMHSNILRQSTQGKPLPLLLQNVVRQIELAFPEWRCSVLILDQDGLLQPIAGPSLPEAYQAELVGIPPGPMVGSCGAAVWHGHRVIAENLQQHPNWAPYRELAARFELGSCWSEPLIDSKGKIHGTFAVYHHTPTAPSPQVITIIEDASRLLALLLENNETHRILNSRTQWYQALLHNAADGLSIIDLNGRFLETSDYLCRMLGYSQEELLNMHLWDLIPGSTPENILQRLASTDEAGETFESVNRTKNGTLIEVEVSARRLILDGQPVVWGSARDISLRKTLQRTLERQATIDALTGLLNRQTLLARLEVMLQLACAQQSALSVLMLDLDHFKAINDQHGHQAGDMVLSELGETLREALRENDAAGRIGGEEFCVLLPGIAQDGAQDIAERLVAEVADMRMRHGEHTLAISCSIGIASWQEHDSSRTLLARADAALYRAKKNGRNQARCLPPPP